MILFVALAAMAGLALAVPAFCRWWGHNAGYALAAGFLALIGMLLPAVGTALGGDAVEGRFTWIPTFDVTVTLRLDGLATLFTLLILGVGVLIMAYCPRYLHGGHHTRTYVLLTLFAAAMLGLVLAADLFLLFVFWELTTVSSFFLIGGTGPRSAKPAMRALVITFAGGLALLAAVVLITVETGTTYLPAILAEPEQLTGSPYAWPVGILLVLAAFTKSAQLPFHSWLPGAMVAITPVSAYLHAATMVKAGVYLLMRMAPAYGDEPAWQATLVSVGLLTAVVGAVLALRQHDLKSLLAYSTVSQLGLLVAATGVGTEAAFAAAVLHTVAHALFKATLFMLVGIIDREAGSRDVRELGGLRRVMPVTAALTGLAGLSMAGVPPLIGFVSKEYIFEGLLEADFAAWAGPAAAATGIAASALTFAYGVRIFHGAFAGPTTQRQLYEPAWQFLAPAAVPAVAGLVLGPAVAVLDPLVGAAAADMAPGAPVPHVYFWHGFTMVLLLSAITIALGLTLFAARAPVEQALLRVRTPPEGALFDRGYDATERLGWWVAAPGRLPSPAPYLAWPVAAVVALGGAALVAAGDWPSAAPEVSAPLDWGVLALLAVAVTGLVLARRAFAAVALLGVVGLLVAVWFVLAGAPDVALTLLLVEVLTALAAVLVLRALPPRFPRVRLPRAVPAAALALGAGVVATAGTLAFTGHRDRSEYGTYFVENASDDTGGSNVVNTILVDYRALDTLGEATVLGVAALGLLILLRDGGRGATAPTTGYTSERVSHFAVFRATYRVLAPVMLVLSAYLFLRGHNAPGGGFIAALVAGVAIAFGWVAHRRAGGRTPVLRSLRPALLVGAGLSVCLAVGLGGLLLGEPFLTPAHTKVGGLSLTTSMVFDLGVYLLVLGLVVATVERLSGAGPSPAHGAPPPAVRGADQRGGAA